jgi:preprotein translocase SecE subunit
MAMSVAEKPLAETAPRSPHKQLAFSSLLGAIFLLAALWLVFAGLPIFWDLLGIHNQFLSSALLLVATILVIVALILVGRQLEGAFGQHGLRAGVVVAALIIYLIAWLSISVIGNFMVERTREMEPMVGLGVTVAIAALLAVLALRMFTRPGFADWLKRLEDRGWFHALPYKPNQGVRVRRGTVIALLTVGVCGIITMISHRALGYERIVGNNVVIPNNWEWTIPFVEPEPGYKLVFVLMYKVHLVMPLVLGALLLWFSWRIVNWPTFADFLIATEAEMNKVSWTTRKRLVQDTVVVLVAVFLLTTFLFLIDILWIQLLSAPFVRVLQVDPTAEKQKQQEKTQW